MIDRSSNADSSLIFKFGDHFAGVCKYSQHLVALTILLTVAGCQQAPEQPQNVAQEEPQIERDNAQVDNLDNRPEAVTVISQPQEEPSSTVPQDYKSKTVALFIDYLHSVEIMNSAVLPRDRRPPEEIFAELAARPKGELLALRYYILSSHNLPKRALDVMGKILPEGHQEFLFKALDRELWGKSAIECLAELDDPTLVPAILDGTKYGTVRPLARTDIPGYFEEIRDYHERNPIGRTAFLMAIYGLRAEAEIRASVASDRKFFRSGALYGLSLSSDDQILPLLLELADLTSEAERRTVRNRFVLEGERNVKELITWLCASPEKEMVAAYALARIDSYLGVSSLLAWYQDEPFENALAAQAAKLNTSAARAFIVDRILNGTRQQRLNAILVADHLAGYDPPVPGSEHPLLKYLLLASHDADADVRRLATQEIYAFAHDAHYPEGRKALRRLVEMFNDPEPRVRSEAALQASQYPSPEVLELLRERLKTEDDERALESITRTTMSLQETLRTLAGSGRKPVYLHERDSSSANLQLPLDRSGI